MRFLDLKASPILRLLSRRQKAPAEVQVEKAETVDALRRLTRQPDWDIYRRLLDASVSEHVRSLLAGGSDAEVHRLRGYIQGLLHAVQIPENLVAQEDNVRNRQQRSSADTARRADADKAALYSSGHWGN